MKVIQFYALLFRHPSSHFTPNRHGSSAHPKKTVVIEVLRVEFEYDASLYSNSTQRRAVLYSTQLIVIG